MTAIAREVAIIGSGFAGIAMAHRLKTIGVDSFVLFERSREPGGVWWDNTYPGCACDIQSHLYSFSFAQNPHWSRKYPQQREIHAYLKTVIENYRLRHHIAFNKTISKLEFNEATGEWRVESSDGTVVNAKKVVMAVGNLNSPSKPRLPGLEDYRGPVFHSAEWRHDVSLRDKHVAVIGTGASAIQFIPEIAKVVSSLTVFQRSAPWILPRNDRYYTEWEKSLFKNVPLIQRLNRAAIFAFNELRGLSVLPSAAGRLAQPLAKRLALRHIKRSIPDPELRAKVTPGDEFGCKRTLLSDDYYPALQRDNVRLVTDAIQSISTNAVHTHNGVAHPADAIILATGFNPAASMDPIRIIGRKGRSLTDEWRAPPGPEAYLGITVNGFPNLYLLNGPNVGLGHNSVVFMLESQVNYVIKHMQLANRLNDGGYLDVKQKVQTAYNTRVQNRLENSVWASGCSNWYRDRASKKNTVLWPRSCVAYNAMTAGASMSEYDIVYPEKDAVTEKRDSHITLMVDGREHSFYAKPDQSILEAALEQGIEPHNSCQSGFCSACCCQIRSGRIEMNEDHTLSDQEIKSGKVLICVGYAKTDRVVLEQM